MLRQPLKAALKALLLTGMGVAALVPGLASAAGTLAGTAIENVASVSYEIGTTPVTTTSNTTSLTVVELIDVDVTLLSSSVSVTPGATQQELVYRVTNTGNGLESFFLLGNSVLLGDDFDPVPEVPFIYFDTDGSGDLSPGDTPYVSGTNDPSLAPDADVVIIVVNSIPGTVTDGQVGRSNLLAESTTGVGAPGDVFAGQGVGGVDAVLGTSGGDDTAQGEYVVSGITLSANKTQTVVDTFGGSLPMPGASITYQVVITATGSGTASNTVFTDAIPADTTYTPGSITLNGAPLTDIVDGDDGQFIALPTPQVRVDLGDLEQADGPQTITFVVTID